MRNWTMLLSLSSSSKSKSKSSPSSSLSSWFVHSSLSSLPPCHQHHIYFDLYPFYVSALSAVVVVIALTIFFLSVLFRSSSTALLLFSSCHFGIKCVLWVRVSLKRKTELLTWLKMKFLAFLLNECVKNEKRGWITSWLSGASHILRKISNFFLFVSFGPRLETLSVSVKTYTFSSASYHAIFSIDFA